MATIKDIAIWMMNEIKETGFLYQESAVYDIIEKFGEEFSYINENGNNAIDKKILYEFRKLTEDSVVWERREKLWRIREDHDTIGKRQVD